VRYHVEDCLAGPDVACVLNHLRECLAKTPEACLCKQMPERVYVEAHDFLTGGPHRGVPPAQ
jgi:hypothetical protein